MLFGVSYAGILKVTSIMQQSEKTVQSPNPVSMTGQRRRLWVTLKQYWLNDTCLRKVYNRPGDSLVLGQRRRRLTDIEPAMGCNAGPTLNLHSLYQVHRRQVLNECWPAPVMVVEVIPVEDI